MTSYHWTGETLRSGEFLPSPEPETRLHLSRDVQAVKRRMLRCFRSQRRVIDALHLPRHERFRPARRYEFRRPPAAPGIYYERFDWGVYSADWCKCAEDALNALHMAPRAMSPSAHP
jgi:hypothetical protein